MTQSENQRIENIKKSIRSAYAKWRARNPILNHQNAIGLSICLLALTGMIASGWAFYSGISPVWLTILLSTFFAAISHEVEHDLIHRIYFRKNTIMCNLMMAIVWVMRPNSVSPWSRRNMHYAHHKKSGSEEDLEERLIGNGMKYGFFRALITADGFLSVTLRARELSKLNTFNYFSFILTGLPLTHFYVMGLYTFLGFHSFIAISSIAGIPLNFPIWLNEAMEVLDFIAIVWLLPNTLRAFCIYSVSSFMHYYGDVNCLLKHCQVLNHPLLMPVNFLCCNFGSTHYIHHFVVSQPFYIRQIVSKEVNAVMKKNGIRFNDFNVVFRDGRYGMAGQAS